jgi:hypothetical protein
MSASGTGIFDDDVACDVRAQFLRLVHDGQTPAAATRTVLRDWRAGLADAEDGPVIWLALAAVQCRHGCLEPRVRTRALAAIDNESDLAHWRSTGKPRLVRSRAAVLARLRAKLAAPPPAQAKLPPARRQRPEPVAEKSLWQPGEVFAYRLRSGRYVLLHVCDFSGSDRPGAGWAPLVALLDWRGKRMPQPKRVAELPYRVRTDDAVAKDSVFMFSLGRQREDELPAARVLRRVGARPTRPWKELVGALGGYRCTRWQDLDQDLELWLGWQ